MSAKETWFTGERSHEGFPLHLRFPEERNYENLPEKYPILIVIEHKLTNVTSSGLPTSEYNESLFELDARITEGMDCIVLVETFGGIRTYYGYSESIEKASVFLKSIESSFPNESFGLDTQRDKDWTFIKRYAEDYEFYRKKG